MDWTIEHHIDAPMARVEAVALARGTLPRIVERAQLIARAEEVGLERGDGWIRREADYWPQLPPDLLPRVVQPEWVQWRETVDWDLEAHSGSFRIDPRLPAVFRPRFRCDGTYTLHPEGERTRRTIVGVLDIRAPLVGPAAERWVVARLWEAFEAEARLLGELA